MIWEEYRMNYLSTEYNYNLSCFWINTKKSKNLQSSSSSVKSESVSEASVSEPFNWTIKGSTWGARSPKSTFQNTSSTFKTWFMAFDQFNLVTPWRALFIKHLTSAILNVEFFLATSDFTCAHINSIGLSSECPTGSRRILMSFP